MQQNPIATIGAFTAEIAGICGFKVVAVIDPAAARGRFQLSHGSPSSSVEIPADCKFDHQAAVTLARKLITLYASQTELLARQRRQIVAPVEANPFYPQAAHANGGAFRAFD